MAVRKSFVRSGTTVDQMVRAIGDRIVTGIVRPGEKLDEIMLAGQFRVSRTPVREALGSSAPWVWSIAARTAAPSWRS